MHPSELVLLSGKAHPFFAESVAQHLKIPLSHRVVTRFSDGEIRVELLEPVRGANVFIIQPTCFPANEHLMEALILVDACRRASAGSITLVMPYFGYGRQDRKTAPRSPITAKLVADLMETAGVDRVLALELHNAAIQGFFRVPVDHLLASSVFFESLHSRFLREELVVVSPDAGGVERARAMAKLFQCGLAIVDKRRDRPNDSVVVHVVGQIQGRDCLLVDDIVDTAGTLVQASQALMEQGARSVSAAVAHGVLSGDALEKVRTSVLKQLFITDSIPQDSKRCEEARVDHVSTALLFAEAIHRIHHQESLKTLTAV